jgi:hypothetical protein
LRAASTLMHNNLQSISGSSKTTACSELWRSNAELFFGEGGELGFVTQMIYESAK